jgi:hypothetical protein
MYFIVGAEVKENKLSKVLIPSTEKIGISLFSTINKSVWLLLLDESQ